MNEKEKTERLWILIHIYEVLKEKSENNEADKVLKIIMSLIG